LFTSCNSNGSSKSVNRTESGSHVVHYWLCSVAGPEAAAAPVCQSEPLAI
jgi:hypothetical protein